MQSEQTHGTFDTPRKWWKRLAPEAQYSAAEVRASARGIWTGASIMVLGHVLGLSFSAQVFGMLAAVAFNYWLARRLAALERP